MNHSGQRDADTVMGLGTILTLRAYYLSPHMADTSPDDHPSALRPRPDPGASVYGARDRERGR